MPLESCGLFEALLRLLGLAMHYNRPGASDTISNLPNGHSRPRPGASVSGRLDEKIEKVLDANPTKAPLAILTANPNGDLKSQELSS